MKPAAAKILLMILSLAGLNIFLVGTAAAQHESAAYAHRSGEKRDGMEIESRDPPEPGDAVRAGEPFRAYNDLIKMRVKCREDVKKAMVNLRGTYADVNSPERVEIEALYAEAAEKNNKLNEAIYNFIRGGNKTSLVNQWIDAEFAYIALVNSHADSHGIHNVCKNCITVLYPLACQYWSAITKLPQRKQLADNFLASVKWG